MKYLDSVALAQLKNLSLDLRGLSADGHSSGKHRSSARGFSHDFSQHRPYAPGDEIKTLDWKIYARQDRFFVREYNEESLLTAHILVDSSGSMGFSGAGAQKWDHACRLAMALAYLVTAQGDAAGLMTFDMEPRQIIPPASRLSHLELMDAALARLTPAGETDLGRVLEATAARVKRRSLLFVISDLLGDPEKIMSVLTALKARRHALMVLQVLDPRERDFDYEGPVVFEGLEGEDAITCDASALAVAYREEFNGLLKRYESVFHHGEIAYAPMFTDKPWDKSLSRFLSRIK